MSSERLLLSPEEGKAPFFAGVDVGGTSIKIGIVDDFGRSINTGEMNDDGSPRSFLSIQTDQNPKTAVNQISRVIDDLISRLKIKKSDCLGVGIGIPGTMDMKTRRLRQPPNLHSWKDFAVCDEFTKESGLPATFCNDANAAAYGEYWVGSASGQSSMALLTLGTGIGCGIIIEGRSIDGATGYGGECGHLLIDGSDNALICGCGQRGHLEADCSASGVARRTIHLTGIRESSLRGRISPETKLGDIARIVFQEAENNDALALEIIDDTAVYLAQGIISICNTVDPAFVVLGGAMTFGGKNHPVGQRFLKKVRDSVDSRTFPTPEIRGLLIDFAMLGADAGFIGAAGLAREESINK